MAQAPRQFAKPSLTPDRLIGLMTARGLVIGNPAECTRALRQIGYYRLSAYMLPYQVGGDVVNRHDFQPGTTFEDILDLYVFDRKLRLLALDALERIEVAFRAAITDTMAVTYGPHWYMASEYFDFRSDPRLDHTKYLDEIRADIGHDAPRRRSVAISHYYATYDRPPLPPSWMVFEAASFGTVARTIRFVRVQDRNRIAKALNMPEPVLTSWVQSLNYLRNTAAHHGRLWNRVFTLKPYRAKQFEEDLARNETCYAQLVTLQVVLRNVSPGSEWPRRLADLLAEHPKVSLARMGFPDDWERRPLWRVRPAPAAPRSHHFTFPLRGRQPAGNAEAAEQPVA